MHLNASQTRVVDNQPPWLANHPELRACAEAIETGTIASLIHLSLQTALKEQPKPFEGILPP